MHPELASGKTADELMDKKMRARMWSCMREIQNVCMRAAVGSKAEFGTRDHIVFSRDWMGPV